jgi:hypothetical protein
MADWFPALGSRWLGGSRVAVAHPSWVAAGAIRLRVLHPCVFCKGGYNESTGLQARY